MADAKKPQGSIPAANVKKPRPVAAAPKPAVSPVAIAAAVSKPEAVLAAPVAKPIAAKPPLASAPAPKPVTTKPPQPKAVAATPAAAPVSAAPRPAPIVTSAPQPAPNTHATETTKPKDKPMNETINPMQNGAAEAMKTGAANAYTSGKAAFEQVTAKSKETIEHGMKSLDEMSAMAKGNVEAMIASTKAATAGLEQIAHQVADFSRKSFEETTAAARAMTTVKTPNELMQLQSDFAKTQFDAAVAEMSKMSETLVKLAGEVFEPVQNRVAVATDKMKTAVGSTFKA